MSEEGLRSIVLIASAIITIGFLFYVCMFRREVEGLRTYSKDKKKEWFNIIILLAIAFVVKLLIATNVVGYDTDMQCFNAWSGMVFNDGPSKFYSSQTFTDYPPGYMLVLWVVGAIRNMFSINYESGANLFIVKLFPVISDVIAGYVLYRISKKKFSEYTSLVLAAFYVFNPVVVLDSSIWGQVDGVLTIFLLLTVYFCMEEKRIPAYFMFAIGVMMKPQMIMFGPILIWTIVEQVFIKNRNMKTIIRDLIGGVSALLSMVVIALPFGVTKVFEQFISTLGSYEYCTINAYNIWALFGLNWKEQSGKFLFMSYQSWGTVFIVLSVALSAYVFFKLKEDKSKYFLSMVVIISTVFLFSVRMHERYMFPIVMLSLAAFLVKPTKQLFVSFVGFSVVQWLNVAHVYYYHDETQSTGPQGGIMGIIVLLTLGIYAYTIIACFSKTKLEDLKVINFGKPKKNQSKKNYIDNKSEKEDKPKEEKSKWLFRATTKMPKFTKWDYIVLGSIIVVYSIFAFVNLGNDYAPETNWKATKVGEEIVLDLGEEKPVDMIYGYLGSYENRHFNVDFSQDGTNYETKGKLNMCSVFMWNELKDEKNGESSYNLAKSYRYIKLTNQEDCCILNELVIKCKDGSFVVPANKDQYKNLFDEQSLYDPDATFMSGTYFDEIYHGRTAYEMINDMYCYENTHPPLGKFLISLGVRAFGMNPFGWRCVGTLFGIFMLPFMYFFGRRLFKARTWAAGALTFLFAFDFMHFVQTRISTIDVYGTFFIIAMYFYMVWYFQTSIYDTKLWKTFIPLGLCAIMMGLGCASKWTAVYAAAGLGVFFFFIIGMRIKEYKIAKNNPNGSTNGIEHSLVINTFKKNTILTLAFCVLFFIVIAGLIYILSYIPFNDSFKNNIERFGDVFEPNDEYGGLYDMLARFLYKRDGSFWDLCGRMLRNQHTMYSYHSNLDATHPFSSTWNEWPVMYKPVYYYSKTFKDGLKAGMSSFGNPLVWWAGIPASLYIGYLAVKLRDKASIFIMYAYAVQMIPWVLVTRCTFAYHYFPSVPFVAMAVVYALVRYVNDDKKKLKHVFVYCGVAFLLFLLFYPVLSGTPVTEEFVRDGLRWLSSWALA